MSDSSTRALSTMYEGETASSHSRISTRSEGCDGPRHGRRRHPSVVFATYQSIQVIADAQKKHGLPAFELIICDEAHSQVRGTPRFRRRFRRLLLPLLAILGLDDGAAWRRR